MQRRSWFVALAAVLLVPLAACGRGASGSPVVESGRAARLVVGVLDDQPGLSLREDGGRLGGFDVDVATYVAFRLGTSPSQITWHPLRADERERALESGTVDLVVATYSITDARRARVTFAGPYFVTGQDVLVRTGESGIATAADLTGRVVCSVAGTSSVERMRTRSGADVRLVEQSGIAECVRALRDHRVDAVTTDSIVLTGFAARSGGALRVVGSPFSEERYGIGIRRNDTEGRARVNAALQRMVDDGAWSAALERHLPSTWAGSRTPPEITER
ncbi:glutamate ABC transporter substrate-binding protein [Lentzea sp. NPDC058436]|uniref:glutamate ABC transporter substrate-binding protein n=1 Tax=Lentzea sp. NPDC058436 TaxID=3346499 RepID=UPI00365D0D1E